MWHYISLDNEIIIKFEPIKNNMWICEKCNSEIDDGLDVCRTCYKRKSLISKISWLVSGIIMVVIVGLSAVGGGLYSNTNSVRLDEPRAIFFAVGFFGIQYLCKRILIKYYKF